MNGWVSEWVSEWHVQNVSVALIVKMSWGFIGGDFDDTVNLTGPDD